MGTIWTPKSGLLRKTWGNHFHFNSMMKGMIFGLEITEVPITVSMSQVGSHQIT